MGMNSIVSGYIEVTDRKKDWRYNRRVIEHFPFDDVYPFTNIFWFDSPARYFLPLIGFVGSYKQIDEDWPEWMWKLSTLLSRLIAVSATVRLECIMGEYFWDLEPESYTISSVGENWDIINASENDFLLHADYMAAWEADQKRRGNVLEGWQPPKRSVPHWRRGLEDSRS